MNAADKSGFDAPAAIESRQRAELRGREAEARSQIDTGVMAANMYAALMGLNTLSAIIMERWAAAGVAALFGATFVLTGMRLRRGSRADAIALWLFFLVIGGFSVAIGAIPWILAVPIWIAAVAAGTRALIGTVKLAQVQADAGATPGAKMVVDDD